MRTRFASARLPWRRLGLIAASAGATFVVCLAGTWIFYQALGHPSHSGKTAAFPAPALNAADDRNSDWRLAQPVSPRLRAAIAHAMTRVAARGDGAYGPAPP